MSSMTASIGISLSWILILSPILYGKEKNIIIPEVTLLKMDQIANKATPITAKVEEKIRERSPRSIPQANENKKKAIRVTRMFIYLNINRVRVMFISVLLPTLCAAFLRIN